MTKLSVNQSLILKSEQISEDAYSKYIGSPEWKKFRKKILKRDGYECQTCLSTEGLEIHHRTYERFGAELPEEG